MDNYATFKTPAVQRWLAGHPCRHVDFTPTGASWLNQVERFFAMLTENQLRRGVHRSAQELEQAIRDYIDTVNANPRRFRWTRSTDAILATIKRFFLHTLVTVQQQHELIRTSESGQVPYTDVRKPRRGIEGGPGEAAAALRISAIDDLIEAVPRKGEHEDQRLAANALEGVRRIGRDVDRAPRPDRRRPVADFDLAATADDVVGLLRLVAVQRKPRAGRNFRNARDDADGVRAFTGKQELPADSASVAEAGMSPQIPVDGGLIDDCWLRCTHRSSPPHSTAAAPACWGDLWLRWRPRKVGDCAVGIAPGSRLDCHRLARHAHAPHSRVRPLPRSLTLRVPNSRIDPNVHLHARPGPERDAFVALVRSFNARGDWPTGWNVRIHDSADLERPRAPPRSQTARTSIATGSIECRLAAGVRGGFHVELAQPRDPAATAIAAYALYVESRNVLLVAWADGLEYVGQSDAPAGCSRPTEPVTRLDRTLGVDPGACGESAGLRSC